MYCCSDLRFARTDTCDTSSCTNAAITLVRIAMCRVDLVNSLTPLMYGLIHWAGFSQYSILLKVFMCALIHPPACTAPSRVPCHTPQGAPSTPFSPLAMPICSRRTFPTKLPYFWSVSQVGSRFKNTAALCVCVFVALWSHVALCCQ